MPLAALRRRRPLPGLQRCGARIDAAAARIGKQHHQHRSHAPAVEEPRREAAPEAVKLRRVLITLAYQRKAEVSHLGRDRRLVMHNGLRPPARETVRVWALCGPEQSRVRQYSVPSSVLMYRPS
jgi:hypothetical protein